jgi:hypothetical protein
MATPLWVTKQQPTADPAERSLDLQLGRGPPGHRGGPCRPAGRPGRHGVVRDAGPDCGELSASPASRRGPRPSPLHRPPRAADEHRRPAGGHGRLDGAGTLAGRAGIGPRCDVRRHHPDRVPHHRASRFASMGGSCPKPAWPSSGCWSARWWPRGMAASPPDRRTPARRPRRRGDMAGVVLPRAWASPQ